MQFEIWMVPAAVCLLAIGYYFWMLKTRIEKVRYDRIMNIGR